MYMIERPVSLGSYKRPAHSTIANEERPNPVLSAEEEMRSFVPLLSFVPDDQRFLRATTIHATQAYRQ